MSDTKPLSLFDARVAEMDSTLRNIRPNTEIFLTYAAAANAKHRAQKGERWARDLLQRASEKHGEKIRNLQSLTTEDLADYEKTRKMAEPRIAALAAAEKAYQEAEKWRRQAPREEPVETRVFLEPLFGLLAAKLGEPDPLSFWQQRDPDLKREPRWHWSRFLRYTANGLKWRQMVNVSLSVDSRGVYLWAERNRGPEPCEERTPHLFVARTDHLHREILCCAVNWNAETAVEELLCSYRMSAGVLTTPEAALAVVLHCARAPEGETLLVNDYWTRHGQ